jgi:hypothetical protein
MDRKNHFSLGLLPHLGGLAVVESLTSSRLLTRWQGQRQGLGPSTALGHEDFLVWRPPCLPCCWIAALKHWSPSHQCPEPRVHFFLVGTPLFSVTASSEIRLGHTEEGAMGATGTKANLSRPCPDHVQVTLAKTAFNAATGTGMVPSLHEGERGESFLSERAAT